MTDPTEPTTDKKTGQATDEAIQARLQRGRKFIELGLAERDRIACRRFLDGSETGAYLIFGEEAMDEGIGVLPEAQEVGNVNYLAINILTKVAAIAMGAPDFFVNCGADDPIVMQQMQDSGQDPGIPKQEQAEFVRHFLRQAWEHFNWTRVFKKVILKRALSGMGMLAYLWHPESGPLFEHVQARDFCADPNTTDWRNSKFMARRLRVTKADAIKRWPDIEEYIPVSFDGIVSLDDSAPTKRDVVEVWCYFDKDTEAYVYGDQILEKGKNLYGRIPILVLEGEIAPESELSIGDYDTNSQIQDQLARLQSMMNNQAENGGAVPWYNPALIDDTSKDAFIDGKPQGFVAVNGDGKDVFGYIAGQPADPMVMEAFQMQLKALDAGTAVSEYQRGVINQSVKFATEAALLANQSGARGNQARIEFEQFVNFAARCLLQMVAAFAPSMMGDANPEDQILLEAIKNVQDIKVIESSTAYKDPNAEMQTNLQLLQAMMPFMQAGFVNPVPLIEDTLRAFGKRNTAQYLMQPQAGQPPPTMVPPPEPQPAPPAPAAGPGGPQITYHEAPQIPSYPPVTIQNHYHEPGSHMSVSKTSRPATPGTAQQPNRKDAAPAAKNGSH